MQSSTQNALLRALGLVLAVLELWGLGFPTCGQAVVLVPTCPHSVSDHPQRPSSESLTAISTRPTWPPFSTRSTNILIYSLFLFLAPEETS